MTNTACSSISEPNVILTVEDQAEVREAIRRSLVKIYPRATIVACASADEAFLQLLDGNIDLIISDFELGPGPTGLALWKWLQKQGRQIPFLLISGRAEREVRDHLGADLAPPPFLGKPFGVGDLRAQLASVLERWGNLAERVA